MSVSKFPSPLNLAPETLGVQPYRDEDDAANLYGSVNGLWNAQPFRPPPAIPLPACSDGCARAQSITEGLDRVGHGTGGKR